MVFVTVTVDTAQLPAPEALPEELTPTELAAAEVEATELAAAELSTTLGTVVIAALIGLFKIWPGISMRQLILGLAACNWDREQLKR